MYPIRLYNDSLTKKVVDHRGPTGRPIRDAADGRVRANAADSRGCPIGRSRGPPSDYGGRADCCVGAEAIFCI
jgi:hypothetical protein